MSIPNRIFRISKAYLSQVRERIDAELSERELDAGIGDVSPTAPGSGGARRPSGSEGENLSPVDPAVSAADEMMRRAEERIAAARRDMESRGELDTPISPVDAVPSTTRTPPPAPPRTVTVSP
ncbi:MAG: hypothetical protein H7Z41_19445, partial [Cytophagales bacterium]|nr:hypothetical protein [Armatimonadota bacterium]